MKAATHQMRAVMMSCGGGVTLDQVDKYAESLAQAVLQAYFAEMRTRACWSQHDEHPGPYVVEDEHVMITYTNNGGETTVRRIQPLKLFYGSTEWDPEPQWLLEAHDFATVAARTFAMKNIKQWDVYERPE